MKTRIGFVSNSSSSSFVALGFRMKLPEDDDERDALEYIYDEPKSIVGELLASEGDSYSLEDREFTLAELNKKAKTLAKKYGKKLSDIKLIMGTVSNSATKCTSLIF